MHVDLRIHDCTCPNLSLNPHVYRASARRRRSSTAVGPVFCVSVPLSKTPRGFANNIEPSTELAPSYSLAMRMTLLGGVQAAGPAVSKFVSLTCAEIFGREAE